MRLLSASELIEDAPYETPLRPLPPPVEKPAAIRKSGRDTSASSHPKNLVYHVECAYALEQASPCLSKAQLEDFICDRVRLFPKNTRQLEQQDELKEIELRKTALLEASAQDRLVLDSLSHYKERPSFRATRPPILLQELDTKDLIFNSKFESGNLYKVMRISESEYNLYLAYDVNSAAYT